jgi:hypothetical protein
MGGGAGGRVGMPRSDWGLAGVIFILGLPDMPILFGGCPHLGWIRPGCSRDPHRLVVGVCKVFRGSRVARALCQPIIAVTVAVFKTCAGRAFESAVRTCGPALTSRTCPWRRGTGMRLCASLPKAEQVCESRSCGPDRPPKIAPGGDRFHNRFLS